MTTKELHERCGELSRRIVKLGADPAFKPSPDALKDFESFVCVNGYILEDYSTVSALITKWKNE